MFAFLSPASLSKGIQTNRQYAKSAKREWTFQLKLFLSLLASLATWRLVLKKPITQDSFRFGQNPVDQLRIVGQQT